MRLGPIERGFISLYGDEFTIRAQAAFFGCRPVSISRNKPGHHRNKSPAGRYFFTIGDDYPGPQPTYPRMWFDEDGRVKRHRTLSELDGDWC